MTDPKVMANGDRLALRILGDHLGLPCDELGHPYRVGEPYQLDGNTLHRIHDWNPLDDSADCFMLQIAFELRVTIKGTMGLYVAKAHESLDATWVSFHGAESLEERAEKARRALVYKALECVNERNEKQATLATDGEAV